MKQAITNLSKDENALLQQLCEQFSLTPASAAKTHKYYRELRKFTLHAHQTPAVDPLMRAAVLLAEQSQPILTLRGDRIKAFPLLLGPVVSTTSDLQALTRGLQLYLLHSRSIDLELRTELASLVDELKMASEMVTKFQRALQHFDFQERVETGLNYQSLFRSFTWVLFLLMRGRIQANSTYQADYLLIAVLYLVVRYAFKYLCPRTMDHLQLNSGKSLVSSIMQQLFSIFVIDYPQAFKAITSKVDNHFQQLVNAQIICCRHDYDFLSPALLGNNYKTLDSLYQRENTGQSLDYRLVLQGRVQTLTPAKHSRLTSRHLPPQPKTQGFTSHKILAFDQDVHHQVTQPLQNRSESIKLPANVRVSPSYIRTPLICAQRNSPNSIQSYMRRSIKNNRYGIEMLDNEKQVLEVIHSIVQGFGQGRGKDRVVLTYNYYLSLITHYINEEEVEEEDLNGLHCSSLLHSLLFTLINSQNCQMSVFVREQIDRVKVSVEANGYDLWIISSYLLRDKDLMPSMLVDVLVNIQQYCINQLIWQEPTINEIEYYSKRINECQDSVHVSNIVKLIGEVLNNLRSMTGKLLITFDLDENVEQLSDSILSTCKYIISHASCIINNRHLHQIFLSICYRFLRVPPTNIRFNDIILNHQQANQIGNNEFKHIICETYIQTEHQDYEGNIIEFFNKNFVTYSKQHLSHINPNFIHDLIPIYKQIREKPRFSNSSNSQNRHLCVVYENSRKRGSLKNHKIQTQQNQHRLKENYVLVQIEKTAPQLSQHDQKVLQKDKNTVAGQDQVRDETKLRMRPSQVTLNFQKTEKSKSPISFR